MKLPFNIQKLIGEVAKLPGVGPKSAKRIVFHLISKNPRLIDDLSGALLAVKQKVHPCDICFALIDTKECQDCFRLRETDKICVVEEAQNIFSIESSGIYRGLYHVLQGLLSPMRGIHPENIRLKELEQRLEKTPCEELILALNPNLEGEATCHYITEFLKDKVGKITRLAVGMPSGGDLEYSDAKTLSQAFEHRLIFE